MLGARCTIKLYNLYHTKDLLRKPWKICSNWVRRKFNKMNGTEFGGRWKASLGNVAVDPYFLTHVGPYHRKQSSINICFPDSERPPFQHHLFSSPKLNEEKRCSLRPLNLAPLDWEKDKRQDGSGRPLHPG
jgi:hypothetical protein